MSCAAWQGMAIACLVLVPLCVGGYSGDSYAQESGNATGTPVESIEHCKEGARKSPGGIFALYVFCDDAAGVNAGVVCVKLECEKFGVQWTVARRFWQESAWSSGLTSFLWIDSGEKLIIGTSSVNGTGECYLLDIPARTFAAIRSPDDVKYPGRCTVEEAKWGDGLLKAKILIEAYNYEYDGWTDIRSLLSDK